MSRCSHRWRGIRRAGLAVAAILVAGQIAVEAGLAPASGQSRSTPASSFSALSTAADAAREAGQLDEATALYRKALAVRPDWTDGWWGLGTILYERDVYRDAARAFGRVVALDPKNGTAHLMLALCEYQVDRDASAMAHIQAAKKLGVQKAGDLPQVLTYHEAMLLLRAGRYERALDVLQPLVAAGVDDESLDFALGLGVLLTRPREAPADGSAARGIVVRAGRAERFFLSKAFDAAKKEYDSLAGEAPMVPNLRYAYGRCLLGLGDLDGAVAQFLAEIENQPGHVRARMLIASARYRIDSAAGIPFARAVVTLQPRYPFGHYLLGLLYFDAGDISRATPALEEAARLVPQEPQFQFALGNAYARAGRKEDAARARAAFVRLRNGDASSVTREYDKLPHLGLDDAAGAEPSEPTRKRPPKN